MANMTLITSVTVGSGGAASVTLPATGTIPQTYTDLKIVISARSSYVTDPDVNIYAKFNGSSTGYSSRAVFGNGSGAFSYSSTTAGYTGLINASAATASTFGSTEIYIPNYTSTNY